MSVSESEFEGRVISNPDPNSQAAAIAATPYAASQRRRVWKIIRAHPDGLACWEVEEYIQNHGGLGLHQSVSATINWLFNHGWLERVGYNKTRQNRQAYIYKAIYGGTT